jgi:hypothetical protein
MRSMLLSAAAAALILLAGATGSNPQTGRSPPVEPQQSGAQKMLQTESGKAGKEEPGSHIAKDSAGDPNAVFVNGALNVPGAPDNTETVPAKFSQKNAADDRLITIGNTLKILPSKQQEAIYQSLKDAQPVIAPGADLGTELPFEVELRPIPSELVKRVPLLDGYQYAVSNRRVMVVYPATRIVVGVFPSNEAITTGAGQGAQ